MQGIILMLNDLEIKSLINEEKELRA